MSITPALAFYAKATFVLSAYSLQQLPPEEGMEIAFAGRSNVGKSSLINALCGRRQLVRVSKTPGRTQALNVFSLHEGQRLVDLPGYGYAKAPLEAQNRWQELVGKYLTKRRSLLGLVIIMDIRHPLQPLDWQMLEWAYEASRDRELWHCVLVLNKADKLKRGAAKQVWQQVGNAVRERFAQTFHVHLCSAENGDGVEELRQMIKDWMQKKAPVTKGEGTGA